jgi:hypothetical protein
MGRGLPGHPCHASYKVLTKFFGEVGGVRIVRDTSKILYKITLTRESCSFTVEQIVQPL